MADMMFPKEGRKKPRKKHMDSIIQAKDGGCYLCEKLHGDFRKKWTEEHHIYFGHGQRAISEANGFKAYLCIEHHRTGKEAVHRCHETCLILQQDAQRAFEKSHTRGEFMELVGKNYL